MFGAYGDCIVCDWLLDDLMVGDLSVGDGFGKRGVCTVYKNTSSVASPGLLLFLWLHLHPKR